MIDPAKLYREARQDDQYIAMVVTPDGIMVSTTVTASLYLNGDLFWEVLRSDITSAIHESRMGREENKVHETWEAIKRSREALAADDEPHSESPDPEP